MAKKKYHQSMRDKMHESKGEMRHMMREKMDRMHESEGEMRHMMKEKTAELKEVKSREMYADYDSRRRLEQEDYYMIHEDKSAMANLPQEVMIKKFPRERFNLDPYLDDTQTGIDRQIDGDLSQMRRHISKTKY